MTFDIEILSRTPIGPFSYRWPEGVEEFDHGWEIRFVDNGATRTAKHGIGARIVYGEPRVHSVTWLGSTPMVEGVASDDHLASRGLVSLIKVHGKRLVRSLDDIPSGYERFEIVAHRTEIDAKFSKRCLAVKIVEDDVDAWLMHALLRASDRDARPSGNRRPPRPNTRPSKPRSTTPTPLTSGTSYPPMSMDAKQAVVASLLDLSKSLRDREPSFTSDPEASAFVVTNPFAFLLAVIADHGIVAERAWGIPYQLKLRLGHLDPVRMATGDAEILAAFSQKPSLHRFNPTIARWTAEAARIVLQRWEGDAGRIWANEPTASDLQQRFITFPGIAQKKSAMAVEILERDLKVPVKGLHGSDVAVDVHLRRVMMRAGLAERDNAEHMIAVARELHPDRPGELDYPIWHVGRNSCDARAPRCTSCELAEVCPKFVERGDPVKGV